MAILGITKSFFSVSRRTPCFCYHILDLASLLTIPACVWKLGCTRRGRLLFLLLGECGEPTPVHNAVIFGQYTVSSYDQCGDSLLQYTKT